MTSEQKQNIALAAEALIIIYLLMQKKKECESKGGGGGGMASVDPTQLPPIRIFTPSITTTTTPLTPTTTPVTTTPTTTVVTPDTEPVTDKGFRTAGIKPSTRREAPIDPEIIGEPCPNMEGWYICPSTTKCYPPLDQADTAYDYCGDGNTPTMKNFANYVKEANFFRQKRSRFR